MSSTLDRYKNDFDSLVERGERLYFAMLAENLPEQLDSILKKEQRINLKEFVKLLPSFRDAYQAWYTEARALVRQLLPDRLSDFVSHYEKPKARKHITSENYRIADYLQGLTVTRGFETSVGPKDAIPQFQQQQSILKSVRARFESSLFDIRQLVQADLFDSELDAAAELARNGFTRAAGALAGVVLERHLAQVCIDHGLATRKKNASIGDLNEVLRKGGVIEVPAWRFIQHLADVRNLCDHSKGQDPSAEQISDLISGVGKITKTVM